ncbi:MAG: type II toxin-antitoxin system RelB/DinJ family antitoxin [Clostridia bacterium]|nr:type II toxin-antitoxin system RelB/DinJ family antitoxin [Clostridia bacterium]
MATVNVTIRMDEQLKKQADELFSDLGINLSTALTMFAKQAVREQRIPFEIKRSNLSMASDDTLLAVSKQLIETNREAYKELAK